MQQSPPHSKTGSQQKTIRSTSIGNVHSHSHYQQQSAARFPRNSSRGRKLKRDRLDSDSSDGALTKEHEREQRRQKKLELQNRFKLNPEKEADPNYMLGRSRLMIRIHKIEHKACVQSETVLVPIGSCGDTRNQINSDDACFTGLNDGLYTGCSSGIVDAADTTAIAVRLIMANKITAGILEYSGGNGPLPAALGPAVVIAGASFPIE